MKNSILTAIEAFIIIIALFVLVISTAVLFTTGQIFTGLVTLAITIVLIFLAKDAI